MRTLVAFLANAFHRRDVFVKRIVERYVGSLAMLIPPAIVAGILIYGTKLLQELGLGRETRGIIVTVVAVLASVAMLGTFAVKFVDW